MILSSSEGWEGVALMLSALLKEMLKGEGFVGLYLTGSATLGDWHFGKSDLDFICITQKPVPVEQSKALTRAMKAIAKAFPKSNIECQYIPEDRLGKNVGGILAYHEGKHRVFEFNLNPVTWHMLKHRGIVVSGKPIAELEIPFEKSSLSAYARKNLVEYWLTRLNNMQKPLSIAGFASLFDSWVEWCACGISRIAYTIAEEDVVGKLQAAEYMLARSPEGHKKILKEAIEIRKGSKKRQFKSVFERRKALLAYMQAVIDLYTPGRSFL